MGDDPRYWAEVERILKRDSRLQANSVIENGEGTFITSENRLEIVFQTFFVMIFITFCNFFYCRIFFYIYYIFL